MLDTGIEINAYPKHSFKGTVSRDFLLFAPENNTRVISNFSKISQKSHGAPPISTNRWQFATGINDTSSIFYYQCQRRWWQIATSINDTGGKFATGDNDTGGKQWEQYQTADNLKGT